MARPRVYKTEAIILKRTNLGEADRIVTLYTPNYGKLRAVAKGARKPRSKLGGHLEPLTHSLLVLAQGQNLDIITQCQTRESFPPLRSDLWLTGCALYIAELVDQFTEEHTDSYPVYRLLHDVLHWICDARSPELALRYFELHLLSRLGYEPELYSCLKCRASVAPERNYFSVTDGGLLCPRCFERKPLSYTVSVDALKVARFLLAGDCAAVDRLRVRPELSRELEQLTRVYIRYILERDVKSAAFLDRMKADGSLDLQKVR
jgi:DNA repair protein RecO (recombination protein O)